MMSSSKRQIAGLIQRMRDAEVSIDANRASGGLRRTAEALNDIPFETRSAGDDVRVIMTASGQLLKVTLAQGATSRYDAETLSEMVCRTLSQAEEIMRQAIHLLTDRK